MSAPTALLGDYAQDYLLSIIPDWVVVANWGGKFGIPLKENDLPGTVARAREHYERLSDRADR